MMYPTEITRRLESSPEDMAAAWVDGPPPTPAPIVIEPYDAHWPELFEREAEKIRIVLGAVAISVEHVGSTAVPGLAAKPILDIDLIVVNSADESAYAEPLEHAGYRLVIREPNWHEHRMFRGEDPQVNLHVFSPNSPEHIRHVIFRDWLRAHDDARARYEDAKKYLAATTVDAPEGYNLAKNTVIDLIYAQAFDAAKP